MKYQAFSLRVDAPLQQLRVSACSSLEIHPASCEVIRNLSVAPFRQSTGHSPEMGFLHYAEIARAQFACEGVDKIVHPFSRLLELQVSNLKGRVGELVEHITEKAPRLRVLTVVVRSLKENCLRVKSNSLLLVVLVETRQLTKLVIEGKARPLVHSSHLISLSKS